jgi:hypothetical protein
MRSLAGSDLQHLINIHGAHPLSTVSHMVIVQGLAQNQAQARYTVVHDLLDRKHRL